MDQFVLITPQLYDQKIRLPPQRLDKYNEKQDSIPKNVETLLNKLTLKQSLQATNHLSVKF